MTTQLMSDCLYFVAFVVVAVFTRATVVRSAAAVAGGAAFGVVALGVFAIGEWLVAWWWHWNLGHEWYFLELLYLHFVILAAPVNLVAWRVDRKFGWHGLAVATIFLSVMVPLWDCWIMARATGANPVWGELQAGIAPVVAIISTYALLVPVGHTVMRLVAGPARGSRLARWLWEASPRPLPSIMIGAGFSGLVCAAAILVRALSDSRSRDVEDLPYMVLQPAVLGSLAGSALRFGVWAMRPQRVLSLPWLVVSRGLLGGGVAVLLLAAFATVFGWATRASADFTGVTHPSSPPTRMEGAVAGLIITVLLALPVFAWGCIVAAVVAPATRARLVGSATTDAESGGA